MKLMAASWNYPYVTAVQEVRAFGRVFRLRNRLPVTISYEDDDAWWIRSQELGISAFGHTRAEALDSFCEDFAVFWEAIAQAPDDTLATDALAAKRAFNSLVAAVEAE